MTGLAPARPETRRHARTDAIRHAGLGAPVALLRRDLTERTLFRMPLVLDLVFGMMNLLVFLFISRVLVPAGGHESFASGAYFDFVAVGIIFMLVVQSATTQLISRVSREQRAGTLEMLVGQPVPASLLALGLAAYPLLFVLLRATAYLAVLALCFGLGVGHADWLGVAVVLLTGATTMMAVGLVLVALSLTVGHGDTLARLLVVAFSFLSGTYFPITALPGPLPGLTTVLPTRSALDGLRAALSGGDWMGSAGALLVAALVLLPLGCWMFDRALRGAARRGVLTRD
ncbi:ABC transporter permease [Micromonospora endophytica]|uniref:Transport permease protein n=1 Tax=Micromonospora endophytica TaxID=515350 RepID=A0A2W2D3K9_9ACTN|nr:ABC transporter permease [Micromonospora endophytica]PZF87083.1 hypothetical protein C1I93_26785 [Micromonospora endophytica]RIW41647.1 ABC transporter permease [Micromonospora endophytica]BCJ62917.1 hypothetical protein Jiend_63390 [Micromonospora endophytica]